MGRRIGRGRIGCAVALAVVLSGTAASAGVAPTEPEPGAGSFEYSGSGCVEVSAAQWVDPEGVASYVPDEFQLQLSRGLARLYIAEMRCEELVVAGAAPSPGAVTEVGVRIDPPLAGDGTAYEGTHYYEIWQLNSLGNLRDLLEDMGMRGGTVKNMTFELSATAGPVVSLDATVPWKKSSYGYDMEFLAARQNPVAASNFWWHAGDQSPFRIAYEFADLTSDLGTGDLEASGLLDKMLGPDSSRSCGAASHSAAPPAARPMSCSLFHFDFRASVNYADVATSSTP